MEYNFKEIEQKWQKYWAEKKTFHVETDTSKPKYYVLDMFPYPSGSGLHVGHPLGYIASDIYARYKRLRGFNVLHPMGYDAFGLPAEQYAIQTGQHPAITTEQNIKRYRQQLDMMGFSFDWEREVNTSDPKFYKWTQWIFLKLFNSWYNPETDKAESIESLVNKFKVQGSKFKVGGEEKTFQELSERELSDVLMDYRLAYLDEAMVNWCPALGTVLANDEVKDGVSERGGYPVERKKMKQWSLRITSYAQRLLDDLESVDWTESIKEQQRNWIGRSEGCSVKFKVQRPVLSQSKGSKFKDHGHGHYERSEESLSSKQQTSDEVGIEVFTTRPDTIFGATFITLAPESEIISEITTDEYRKAVEEYVEYAKNRTERERQSETKKITGQFTGAYAVHPFSGDKMPIWIGEYVLSGYGTGAVMGVPAHDERDHSFAKHFGLEIKQVIETPEGWDIMQASYDTKEGRCIHSDFLNGLLVKDAIRSAISEIEKMRIGQGKINYRLRDAAFGRQRYWGEPIPIYYKEVQRSTLNVQCEQPAEYIPLGVDESDLPIVLPQVDKFLPTETGEPPLARAMGWKYKDEYDFETTTMPGWAGSSWYYLRYMDAHNDKAFASKDALNYWKDVDLYIGGSEHATGHLLYVRFWTKFLYDLGLISITEPAKKLINQGMIQGRSNLVFRIKDSNRFVSYNLRNRFETTALHVDVNMVENDELDIEAFKMWRDEFRDAEFILENGKYLCGSEIEKMSKRWHNVVNPEDIIEKNGADAFRLYEMFLGPLELSKPWNTNGLSGTSNFIRKLWRLYHSGQGAHSFHVTEAHPSKAELKILHKTIKKATEDVERFSFNTSVSSFMICVNELTDLKCNKRAILEPLIILIAPYAPHIAEEIWEKSGHRQSITFAKWPEVNEEYLKEDSFSYPISINGKTKTNVELSLSLTKEAIESEVLKAVEVQKYLQGNKPKKVIVVPGRIVNIVV